MKYMKHLLVTISVLLTGLGAGLLVPATALAANQAVSDACGAINAGTNCDQPTGVSLTSVVTSAIKILSIVVGVAAIFMLIIAGMKFVTSGGDPSSVSSARNMIIYSLVGIILAGTAYALVGYVFHAMK